MAQGIASMTGYARREGRLGDDAWTWELKSVNGRSLDLRCRLGTGGEHLELPVRAALGNRLKRGNVSVNLSFLSRVGRARLVVNRAVLDQALALMKELEGRIDAAPPRLDGLLSIKGVVESVEDGEDSAAAETRDAALLESLGATIGLLIEGRRAEGARLAAVLTGQLDEIESLVSAAAGTAAARPEAIRARLAQQLATLFEAGTGLNQERVAQEAALIAVKADIREEIDRLRGHVEAARAMLTEGGAVGRRLDFLCQELNREANTLCSKSADMALTRIGLTLKSVIEQLREQIQNIE